MTPSNIAVIGGSGFIGGVLIRRLLAAGHHVRNLDITPPTQNTEAEFRNVDVRDQAALIAALDRMDVIYLLAAEHRDDVRPIQKYYDVNVGGARNVVTAAQHLGIRHIIFTSSVALYGLNSQNADESREPAPFNDYGKSKLEAEQVLTQWQSAAAGRILSIMRPVVVFGPGNRGNVYTLLKQIQSRAFAMIGDGNNRKSMAYVENVAAFLEFLLDRSIGLHVYNYADQPDLTMNELLEIAAPLRSKRRLVRIPYWAGISAGYGFDVLATVTGRTFPISSVRVKKFCADTTINASRAHSSGFYATDTFRSGLTRMIKVEFPETNSA